MPLNGEYCIWSIEHSAWWRPARMGYTREFSEAGVYSAAESERIVLGANVVKFHECRIPVACLRPLVEQAAGRWPV